MPSNKKSFQNYVSRGLIRIFPKNTVYLGDITCFCGHAGVLNMDLRCPTTHYYVRHFNEEGNGWTNHNSKYSHVHYIGDKFNLGVAN